jgi:hypothetical protein
MKQLLQTVAVTTLLLGAALPAHAQVSFDFHIGTPPPPPRAYAVPVQPGPDYAWVEGYWYPVNGRYVWHNGYWTREPYAGAYWVAPYWEGGTYYAGHWEGRRGNVFHNHGWDRSERRDFRREPQRERGHEEHGREGGHEEHERR